MSVTGVGYREGILSLTGGVGIYIATIVYWGSVDKSTPIKSD